MEDGIFGEFACGIVVDVDGDDGGRESEDGEEFSNVNSFVDSGVECDVFGLGSRLSDQNLFD
jgi:hypothetical protein